MSRLNKVNKDHYTIAGRLTPDEIARERQKQRLARHPKDRDLPPQRAAKTKPVKASPRPVRKPVARTAATRARTRSPARRVSTGR